MVKAAKMVLESEAIGKDPSDKEHLKKADASVVAISSGRIACRMLAPFQILKIRELYRDRGKHNMHLRAMKIKSHRKSPRARGIKTLTREKREANMNVTLEELGPSKQIEKMRSDLPERRRGWQKLDVYF